MVVLIVKLSIAVRSSWPAGADDEDPEEVPPPQAASRPPSPARAVVPRNSRRPKRLMVLSCATVVCVALSGAESAGPGLPGAVADCPALGRAAPESLFIAASSPEVWSLHWNIMTNDAEAEDVTTR
jgi:hypothetical protein